MEYSDFIQEYNIKKSVITNYDKALKELCKSDYDGIEYAETITLENKQEQIIKLDDIIYNIECDDTLYYVVNEKVYPVESHTRFITACCPFTNIYFGIINDAEKIPIKFDRIILKMKIRDEMIDKVDRDYNIGYYMGMLYIK